MSKITKKTFSVLDMHSAACANNVEKAVAALPGVKAASVNLATNILLVGYDSDKQSPQSIKRAVIAAGCDLLLVNQQNIDEEETLQREKYKKQKRRFIEVGSLTLVVVTITTFFENFSYANEVMLILTLFSLFRYGKPFYLSAWKQLKSRRSNMDSLVALTTGVAFVFSSFNTLFPEFWFERSLYPHVYYAATMVIIAFVLAGKLMEERAKGSTTSAIKKLMGMQPITARILSEGEEKDVLIEELRAGDRVIVKPGERIPVDGTIVTGESNVDESMISGEPIPVSKGPEDNVLAGTMNQRGTFVLEAQKVGAETVLARIIEMVQEAQGSKPPVQRIVDKVTSVFVPIVLILSVLTFAGWVTLGGTSYVSHGLLSAVSVLVMACPCALGLATPTALMVGIGKGARHHILIKDALALEQARRVDVIVFDKTGTITDGHPTVTGWLWEVPQQDIYKQLLLAAEKKSDHPLAESIVEALEAKHEIAPIELENFVSKLGKGVEFSYEGEKYWVGSRRLMEENGASISTILRPMMERYETKGNGIVHFGRGEKLLAIIAVADRIKPTSKEAIKELKRQGYQICMLTGDGERTASAVANKLGISEYVSEALPGMKEEYIRNLQKEGRVVAMVGDGINDSQALASADVSVAMGKGTDVAMDVAMITLITSDLLLLPKAFKLSKKTVALIRQNLFWAFIFNLIGIPVAAGLFYPIFGWLLNPMMVSLAMILSSASVLLNSLSLIQRRL